MRSGQRQPKRVAPVLRRRRGRYLIHGAEIPEAIVFDAEPLITFCNEQGSDTVETDAVEDSADGYISAINLAEIHYIIRAIDGEERIAAVVNVLSESGIRRVDTEQT